MRKKSSGRKAERILSLTEDHHIDTAVIGETSKGWWRGLSRNSQWLAIGIVASLSISALGAGLKYLDEDARKQNVLAAKDRSLLASINPFIPAPSPSPTPQLSKEYIYAGSRLLAVEDANASAASPADLAVWRPSNGTWYVLGGTGSQATTQGWGLSGDTPAPGDFDGDGKTDFSVFRPSNSTWYIIQSGDSSVITVSFGLSGDIPSPADFDGDGKTDRAVWRPSNGHWYILRSSDNGLIDQEFGVSGDVPAATDYDGDGKADMAVWHGTSTAGFYVLRSSDIQVQNNAFGQAGDIPVAADYDGDGKADFAVRRGADWMFLYSSNGQTETITWQFAADKAVPNDYDGDGKVDIAVWRDSNGNWYIRQSATATLRQVWWGLSGDIPVPAYYRR